MSKDLNMKLGNLYMLQGLQKNKHEKWMRTLYGTLANTSNELSHRSDMHVYTDGAVFLCMGEDGEHRYKVLTPQGDIVVLWRNGNKTKFREV
jgi:hypothetical protein